MEATVTLVDQRQPVDLYHVARGLRWKVREVLDGWMHPGWPGRTYKKPVVEKRYRLRGKRVTRAAKPVSRRILLDGLARNADILRLASELAPLHPGNNTFPGEVFLRLAAGALDWCGASREEPLALEGIRERFLPECTFRGRQNHKLQFAVLAAAALRGGAEPDLLDEVA